MSRSILVAALALAIGLSACGQSTQSAADPGHTSSAAPSSGAANDADAIARAAVVEMRLPDPEGEVVKKLAEALRALPPWAPFYPGARLGLDSGSDAPGSVQISFTTPDPEDKVAAFYLQKLRPRGAPTDLKEAGVRTIEVSAADDAQITSVILSPADDGRVAVVLKHEGGGY